MSEISINICDQCVFENIRMAAPSFLQDIPNDTQIIKITVPFGEVISISSSNKKQGEDEGQNENETRYPYHELIKKYLDKGYIAIVINGVAELFDLSSYNQTVAYRPIRLLNQSQIFGEFSLIDSLVFQNNLAQTKSYNSRPGERWQLISGRRCYLLKERGRSSNFKKELGKLCPTYVPGNDDDDDGTPGNFDLFNVFRQFKNTMQSTDIALINLHELIGNGDSALRLKLLEIGWERVKIYRDCINSFNFSNLLEMKNLALKLAKNLTTPRGTAIPSTATKWETFVPAFTDALIDALNIPLRNEPVFQNFTDNLLDGVISQLAKWGIGDPQTAILSTSLNYYDSEFYIPLDMHNYLINLYVNGSYIGEDINTIFGSKFTNGENRKQMNARDIYIKLANKIIKKFLFTNNTYPWEVQCVSMNGMCRPMLLLCFNKNK